MGNETEKSNFMTSMAAKYAFTLLRFYTLFKICSEDEVENYKVKSRTPPVAASAVM